MSLFGSKKKIYVASTVYNMLDEDVQRTPYMKEALVSATLTNTSRDSIAESILTSHLEGPRKRLRGFQRWARSNFTESVPEALIDYNQVINNEAVAAEILSDVFNDDPDTTVFVSRTFVDTSDESYYAEQHILENRPELAILDWAADYDPATGDILIQYPDGAEYPTGVPISTESISVPGFNVNNGILLAYYSSTTNGSSSALKLYIYQLRTGNTTLDDFYISAPLEDSKEFYPYIPLRIDNKSVFEAGSPATAKEDLIRKAYKKAFGGDIDDLLTEIEDNDSIDDVDYAYVAFGMSLNTKDKNKQDYIFEFFKTLEFYQNVGVTEYQTYLAVNNAYGGHATISPEGDITEDPNPTKAIRSQSVQANSLQTALPGTDLGQMDMKLTWASIKVEQATGLIEAGAVKGDLLFENGTSFQQRVESSLVNGTYTSYSTVDEVILLKQISSTEYEKITINGLYHKNLIYGGKSVDISGREALDDADPSGFVIPLHEPTLRSMGIVRATEVAREAYIIIFNSYQVVKQKWYQSGLFSFILAVIVIVVVAIITYLTAGAGTPEAAAAGAGILGSAAAVGAYLGFQGLLAIAIGAAVNAIASMIVLSLISSVSTELFGETWGQIITLVASLAITFGTGPGGFSTANISSNIVSLTSMQMLQQMTNVLASISQIVQGAQLEEVQEETAEMTEEYKTQMDLIKEQWEAMGLGGDGLIDPMILTDYTDPSFQMGENYIYSSSQESLGSFIDRTLMTSTEMIDIGFGAIYQFSEATLTLS